MLRKLRSTIENGKKQSLKPDLVIDFTTDFEEIVDFFDKGGGKPQELYSLKTLLDYFYRVGYGETVNAILLEGILNREVTER
ncbi:TPA: hypothetical protein ACGN75_002215 [Streptococcus agalactiae]